MSTNAIDVKDRILAELNEVWENPIEFCKTSEKIIEALKMTDGVWNELGYSYKAQEICDKIAQNLNYMTYNTSHTQTQNRLNSVRAEACRTRDHFHRLQADKFCDIMEVKDEQTRAITRMTNIELAS